MADLDPADALCLCGIRGCVLAEQHRLAFIAPEPAWRRLRPARRRHKRGH